MMTEPADDLTQAAEDATRGKDWPRAIEAWSTLSEKFPDRPRIYARLAEAYRQSEQYETARQMVDDKLKKYKDYLPLHTERAMLATAQADWPAAVQAWKALIDKFEDQAPAGAWVKLAQAYRIQKELNKAEDSVAKGLAKHPEDEDLLEEAARVALAAKDWPLALKRWQVVVERIGQREAWPWRRLSYVQRQIGENDAARQTLKDARRIFPQNTELDWELAEMLTAGEDYAAALKLWQKILPEIPGAHLGQRLYVRLQISLTKRLANLPAYRQVIKGYGFARQKHQPRMAIISSVTKGFDHLMPHEILDWRFDYLMYTDAGFDSLGIYDILPLPKPELDGARASRYMKTHAHELSDRYECVVWLDASLMIVGDIYQLVEQFMASGKPIGANVHPLRHTIQQEYEACLALHKEDPAIMQKQLAAYEAEGFDGQGLAECAFLAFNLRDHAGEVQAAMEAWWDQIQTYSRRDQLSFPYALWEHHVSWYPLTKPPHGIRNHPAFVLTNHQTEYPALAKLTEELSSKPINETNP